MWHIFKYEYLETTQVQEFQEQALLKLMDVLL